MIPWFGWCYLALFAGVVSWSIIDDIRNRKGLGITVLQLVHFAIGVLLAIAYWSDAWMGTLGKAAILLGGFFLTVPILFAYHDWEDAQDPEQNDRENLRDAIGGTALLYVLFIPQILALRVAILNW